jgi:hypothetical protein
MGGLDRPRGQPLGDQDCAAIIDIFTCRPCADEVAKDQGRHAHFRCRTGHLCDVLGRSCDEASIAGALLGHSRCTPCCKHRFSLLRQVQLEACDNVVCGGQRSGTRSGRSRRGGLWIVVGHNFYPEDDDACKRVRHRSEGLVGLAHDAMLLWLVWQMSPKSLCRRCACKCLTEIMTKRVGRYSVWPAVQLVRLDCTTSEVFALHGGNDRRSDFSCLGRATEIGCVKPIVRRHSLDGFHQA